jgi:hypothetical protein
VDGEGFWVRGHDRFEMLVVGIEGSGGDGARFEGLLDRCSDSNDWYNSDHTIGCLLGGWLYDVAVSLDVLIAYGHGLSDFAVFIRDMQRLACLKRDNSGSVVSTRLFSSVMIFKSALTYPKCTAPTKRVSSSLHRTARMVHDRCKAQDPAQYS